MCELLGMSANVPTDICFSFSGLVQRGGKTGPHSDGWGLCFYEGKGCSVFRDPQPSYQSQIAQLLRSYPIKSEVVIGHIRQANCGEPSLANTHPFVRELWGESWSYAHNGQLKGHLELPYCVDQPVGDTDSEHAFCYLLGRLREHYPQKPQDMRELFSYVATLADELRSLGVFNMLLSNGEYLMVYCSNNLHWLTRRAPFSVARLIDEDLSIDFAKETTPDDVVTIIATQPLTHDEAWHKMEPGQWHLFHKGELVV
ncbi:class II glutamine amidotransferase [Dongshaea marina]|uniref:class II glutamine amidotransferase n=1 Tax=Dongshaea marina TaxID=2047966 RepID=UPI000D3ED165|nr:class II glutamine amidotransferase [Dongshaea marina]